MRCRRSRLIEATCLAALLVALAASACNSSKSEPGAPEPEPRAVEPRDAAPAADPGLPSFDPGDRDERAALRDLGAVPVWDAVVDRGEYLARRGQRGVLFGRLGEPIGSYRWLIDDTEGAGSLGIRLAYAPALDEPTPDGPILATGQRVLVWGAWHVDDDRRWYWKAERMAELAATEVKLPPEVMSEPGHRIVELTEPPEDAVPVSERARGPGDILFEVTGFPDDPAAGWEIGDPGSRAPVARLRLPGEHRSYGGQDYRSPDEHWHLERGVRYAVRVRRFLPAKPGELIVMRALNAPRRLVDAP